MPNDTTVSMDERGRYRAEKWNGNWDGQGSYRLLVGIGPTREAAIWAMNYANLHGHKMHIVTTDPTE